MDKFILTTIIALLAINLGLYAQEKDTAQGEPKVKLELVWEKEIPAGTGDIVFLDENGYNVFSSQCKDPEKALKGKRILMIQDGRLKFFESDEMRLVTEIALTGGNITISKNGRNIATIEGLERDPSGKGGFVNKPAILRLYNCKGEELANTQFSPASWEYINFYPLGNDQALAMSKTSEVGHQISVFVKEGRSLREVFKADGQYPTGLLDYAENGSIVFFVHTSWEVPVEHRRSYVKRIVINGEGKEIAKYDYQNPCWAGWVSPKGNYLVEVTRGKYLVIRKRTGEFIAEHHVQGQGNYYTAFSPDEKYLCVTPGFRTIYLFDTKTGEMVWQYNHPDDRPSFFPGCVIPQGELSFVIFTPSKEEKKWIWIFDKKGEISGKIGPLDFVGYSLPLSYNSQTREVFIKLPSKLLLYHISKAEGER